MDIINGFRYFDFFSGFVEGIGMYRKVKFVIFFFKKVFRDVF